MPPKKGLEQDSFTKFYWIFQELTSIFNDLFKTLEREAIFLNYFYEANTTLILKPETQQKKRNTDGYHWWR